MIAEADYDIDSFLDVDFEVEARKIQRLRGQNPDTPASLAKLGAVSTYESTYPGEILPESDWQKIADKLDSEGKWCSELATRIYDQDGEPSCVSNATLQAHEIIQALMFGKERVRHLSQISLYRRCGTRSSGSTLSENLAEMKSVGALLLDDPSNSDTGLILHPGNGYSVTPKSGWEGSAKHIRINEVLRISTYEGFISSLLQGYPVVYARKSHCILAARWFRTKKAVAYINSWGPWGERVNEELTSGFGFDSESLIRNSAGGSFSVRSVIVSNLLWPAK